MRGKPNRKNSLALRQHGRLRKIKVCWFVLKESHSWVSCFSLSWQHLLQLTALGKKEEKSDSFAEKMATQVIKNLQIKVSNIHVRYEDRFTNPEKPFSIGVTLKSLAFQVWHSELRPFLEIR